MTSKPATSRAAIKAPPLETKALYEALAVYLNSEFGGTGRKIGNYKWGVYAFFDYDREPIYVGQTKEGVRTRIRRHLTNQRTDAVAMSVLDPFEVFEIEAWPLPHRQGVGDKHVDYRDACDELNALEHAVWAKALRESRFHAVLNEKDPVPGISHVFTAKNFPLSYRNVIVSPQVDELRGHPDIRLARRASVVARLSQVVVERAVKGGLRRALLIQARRLAHLAEQRYAALGGDATVERGAEEAEPDNED